MALAPPDVQPPSAPGGPTAGFDGLGRVVVEWDPANDDVGIVAHQVFRDALPLMPAGSITRIIGPFPVPGSTHTYAVAALDAASNVSAIASAPPIEIPPADAVSVDGFESGGLYASSVVRGASVVSGGSSGRRAVAFEANGSPAFLRKRLSAASIMCVVGSHVWLSSRGSNPVILLRVLNEAGTGVAQVLVRRDGTLAYKVEQAKRTRGSTAVLPTNGWHALTLGVVASGDSSVVELYLDGVSVISRVESEGISAIGKVQVGDHVRGRTFTLRADDVIVRALADRS